MGEEHYIWHFRINIGRSQSNFVSSSQDTEEDGSSLSSSSSNEDQDQDSRTLVRLTPGKRTRTQPSSRTKTTDKPAQASPGAVLQPAAGVRRRNVAKALRAKTQKDETDNPVYQVPLQPSCLQIGAPCRQADSDPRRNSTLAADKQQLELPSPSRPRFASWKPGGINNIPTQSGSRCSASGIFRAHL